MIGLVIGKNLSFSGVLSIADFGRSTLFFFVSETNLNRGKFPIGKEYSFGREVISLRHSIAKASNHNMYVYELINE